MFDVNGLTIKSIEDILTETEARQRSTIDPTIITAPEEPMGQLNGIYADSERQVWEALQVAYNAFNADATEGFLLDALCALTGTIRQKARYSTVLCMVTLDVGTLISSGLDFAHVDGKPETRFTPIVDYTAPSSGVHQVWFRSENLGPVVANASTLTIIATPRTGWTAVTNALDATLGADEETDDALRLRREQRLQASGSGTPDAIRSAVLGVDGVVSCRVFENTTDYVDAYGVPPHAIEVLVYDGETPAADDDALAQAIWDNRSGGCGYVGTSSGEATDDAGDTHVIYFTRPLVRQIWIEIYVVTTLTDTGQGVLKASIVAQREESNLPGDDVYTNRIICDAMDTPGMIDVQYCEIGFAEGVLSDSNLAIDDREIASFDTSRIAVYVV